MCVCVRMSAQFLTHLSYFYFLSPLIMINMPPTRHFGSSFLWPFSSSCASAAAAAAVLFLLLLAPLFLCFAYCVCVVLV